MLGEQALLTTQSCVNIALAGLTILAWHYMYNLRDLVAADSMLQAPKDASTLNKYTSTHTPNCRSSRGCWQRNPSTQLSEC